MAFFLSLVVSWANPRLREKRLFFYLFAELEFTQKILHYLPFRSQLGLTGFLL